MSKKQLIGILLCLAVALTLLPTAAWAEDGATITINYGRTEGSSTTWNQAELSGTKDDPDYATTDANGQVSSGTADSYNIKWDGETLTLQGATIMNAAGASDSKWSFAISYSGTGPLTINLMGTNRILKSGEDFVNSYGIYAPNASAVKITGTGTLEVTAETTGSNTAYGIYAGGGVTISGTDTGAVVNVVGDIHPQQEPTNLSSCLFLHNGTGTVSGNVTLTNNLTIANGGRLDIPQDSSLTIGTGVKLTNYGTVTTTGDGKLTNNGTIDNYGTLPDDEDIDGGGSITNDHPIYVGGVTFSGSVTNPTYTITTNGAVTTTDANEGNYNVKWDGTTLTLNNATITQGAHEGAAVYHAGDLEIELIGENTVTGPNSPDSTGIYINGGTLTINAADGASLEVSGGHAAGSSISSGIYADGGNITISGGKVTATGGESDSSSYGICASSGDITINGGTVTATGGLSGSNSYGIHASGSVNISWSDGTVTATGGQANGNSYGISAKDVATISGGIVTATGGTSTAVQSNYSYGIYGGQGVTIQDESIVWANATGDGGTPLHTESSYTITKTNSIVFENNVGAVYGRVAPGQLTIGQEESLTVPVGASLVLYDGTSLTNDGELTIEEDGQLTNNGTLTNTGSLTIAAGGELTNSGTITNENEGTIANNGTLTVQQGGTLTGTVTGNAVTYEVTGVRLDRASLSLTVGGTATLNATVEPEGAANQTVSWESSDTSVATVNNGVVTAVSDGTATITATVGGKSASCTVNVSTYIPPVATYAITVESGENGTVRASASRAAAGSRVTLTVSPGEGYALDALTVTGADGSALPLTETATGYTFTMPASAVTVTATFEEINHADTCPGAHFADVDTGAWYHDALDYVLENGLIVGTSDTTFEPEATMSRAQLVTILWRLAGEPVADDGMNFEDVAAGEWYAGAVAWAAENGIVLGTGETTYSPGDPVSREQLAAILYRYAVYQGYDVSIGEDTNILSYTDFDQLSEWAIPAMQWACGAGIIQGTSESTLTPQGDAARAQVAAMLQRFCEGVVQGRS